MALAEYDELYWFPSGQLASQVPVRVFPENSNVLAPLFADAAGTTPLPNPLTTGQDGRLHFWAEAGYYWIYVDSESLRVGVGVGDTGVTPQDVQDAIAAYNRVTTDVHGIADTAQLETQAGAQARADAAQQAAEQDATTALSAHAAQTQGVHGIADTAQLETQADAQARADAARDQAVATAGTIAEADLAVHADDHTGVHGIADTTVLETQAGAQAKADAAKGAAITTAATDATAKANAAQQVAIATASDDATAKADAAVATAAADATAKADAARTGAVADAQAYADATFQRLAVLSVTDYLNNSNPFQGAHRGWGGEYPEHTLAAYTAALSAGAPAIEVSVNLTADGVPVCIHDQNLDRVTGGAWTGNVSAWTYAALSQVVRVKPQGLLGAGWADQPIPTLKQALDLLYGRCVIFLEPKASAAVVPVQQMLEDYYPHAPLSVIWKAPYNSNSFPWAVARGYTTWGYINPDTTPAQMDAVDANVSFWGVPMEASDATFSSVVGRPGGKLVMTWEVHRYCEIARVTALGVRGLMMAQGQYLNAPAAIETHDSFATGVKAPGNFGVGKYDPTYALQYEGGAAYLPRVGGQGCLLGSMSRMAQSSAGYTISFEMMYPQLPTTTLHAGLALCKTSDDPYAFNTANASGGYHLLFRPTTGDLQLYSHTAGVTSGTQLGTVNTGGAVAAGQWVPLQAKVTPTQVILTRTDTGTVLTVNNTTYRGLFFHLHNGSLTDTATIPRFRNFAVAPV